MTKTTGLAGYLHFFWAGLVRHSQTGSFIPSQRFLIDAMIAPVPENFTGHIVELGTGTAPLTLRLTAKAPKAKLHCCEINPVLAQDARRNLARAGVNGNVKVHTMSAQELLAEIQRVPERPSFVISGLPIGNLGRARVLELLEASKEALAPKGMFIQAQHFLVDRRNVRATFRNVRTVPVLRNFPPVFVYYARK
ncbi:MAG TPA: methyltransferase [Patescibacteria group bacterium]|jgi:phospholipid N-methyltransferase|nr:methyltransferase [Patescibacteria group bacterium]